MNSISLQLVHGSGSIAINPKDIERADLATFKDGKADSRFAAARKAGRIHSDASRCVLTMKSGERHEVFVTDSQYEALTAGR